MPNEKLKKLKKRSSKSLKNLIMVPAFIKIPREFFEVELADPGPGWILNFEDDQKLIFRKVENKIVPDVRKEVAINSNSFGITYVDQFLNDIDSGTISSVFGFDNPDYDNSNWISEDDKSKVPFFYIDKEMLYTMYADGNFYFLSPEIFTYTSSAIAAQIDFSLLPIIAGSNNELVYDLIKIECVKIVTTQSTNGTQPNLPNVSIGNHPVETKVIFALPCPPEWNPAFAGIYTGILETVQV